MLYIAVERTLFVACAFEYYAKWREIRTKTKYMFKHYIRFGMTVHATTLYAQLITPQRRKSQSFRKCVYVYSIFYDLFVLIVFIVEIYSVD